MQKCKKILAPVDLAEFSLGIVPLVKIAVEKLQAELHFLHVVPPLREYTGAQVPNIQITHTFQTEALQEAHKELMNLVQQHFPECPSPTVKVVEGHPADEILRYVASEGIDMIIMSTHGRKGIDRLIFGSVAEQVLKSSTVPILAFKPSRTPKTKKLFDLSFSGDEELEAELEQYKS